MVATVAVRDVVATVAVCDMVGGGTLGAVPVQVVGVIEDGLLDRAKGTSDPVSRLVSDRLEREIRALLLMPREPAAPARLGGDPRGGAGAGGRHDGPGLSWPRRGST